MNTTVKWLKTTTTGLIAGFSLVAGMALAQEGGDKQSMDVPRPMDKQVSYSPVPGQDFPNAVFFGDTHLHTSYSTDAGMVGKSLEPREAFRISRGEALESSHGVPVQLKRPFDFVVVADHAENLGLAPAIAVSDKDLLKNEWGKMVHDLVKKGDPAGAFDEWLIVLGALEDPLKGSDMASTYWQKATAAAEEFNEPGLFTAFIGFEWTAAPNGNNLHRNVIFRDGKDKADTIVPMSAYDSSNPEDLWTWMEKYEATTGGQLLAIPHNGNLSNGLMFDDITLESKKPISAEYAKRRQKFERLYEVTQMKGDSEAHPALSPDDEFADYGTWDTATLGAASTTSDMWPREYAREALKRGMDHKNKLGVNPFKFGLIGSTDSHTSIPSTEEDNFFGKVSMLEPSADPIRFEEIIAGRMNPDASTHIRAYRTLASGLAAVWSRENTREALWDAMHRREVYGTTGTRPLVRVFGGYDLEARDLDRSNFAEYGYANGVPMGGDLAATPGSKAPTMLVRALRDVDGANLDRIQVIKGWVDAKGVTQERVYDVAVSDGRKIDSDGRCKTPVGNTVDVVDASYTNAIGEPFLQGAWTDPSFDPALRAFYYVRVIEIPTPRWTTYDAKHFGVKIPQDIPPFGLERAYTSPIWYDPRG